MKLLKQLGVSHYRFSVAWPRVMPAGTGPVNQPGLDYYDKLVDALVQEAEASLNGRGRIVIRPSGTEPLVRVMGEGEDAALVTRVVDEICVALADVAARGDAAGGSERSPQARAA